MHPKLFISYGWSSREHEKWVLGLAKELREAGVDVILDKWDLKEGHDAHAFMERMVSDPDIKKVVLICDKEYAEKADKRSGGVGTETQIITPELYAKQEQSKFVAIVTERAEDGTPYLPTYYKSRIYIDLGEASDYASNFEQLVRWIYDKPIYEKPELGKIPVYLNQTGNTIQLATSARLKRAIDAVKNGHDYAIPAIKDYFATLTEELEKFRITQKAGHFDEQVIEKIDSFLPYRNEFVSLFLTICKYRDWEEIGVVIHRFLEKLIPYMEHPPSVSSWESWDYDYFKFIVDEIFLCAFASFIKYERFSSAAYLLNNDYYDPGRSYRGKDVMVPFTTFNHSLDALEARNNRLKLLRISLHADILKKRCSGSGLEFRYLMEADFVLYMRAGIEGGDSWWWPKTLVCVDHTASPFEIFARSRSTSYFEKVKPLLGIATKDQLQTLLERLEAKLSELPDPRLLIGFDALATKP
jgi:hypothetical protein